MEIKDLVRNNRVGGPAEWFTGSVRIHPLFEALEPPRVRCASVAFEPGARTAWHTHPLGQRLDLLRSDRRALRSREKVRRKK